MTRVVGVGLLASAFAPLVALLAIIKLDELGWVGWLILSLCLGAVVLLTVVLRSLGGIQTRSVEASSVRRVDLAVKAWGPHRARGRATRKQLLHQQLRRQCLLGPS